MRAAASMVLSDPVHGFISVPRGVIDVLLHTPHVQRLRRIRQLGVGFLVFPGAEHSRFTHAIGAMALMRKTLDILANKGTPVSEEEKLAAMAAALLHDVGHAPFSHSFEYCLIPGVAHEAITAALIGSLAQEIGPPLDLALAMFEGSYERSFFHDLISSQLDMDRLDYLRRDSHFTGVIEGRIGVERILRTMCVHPKSGGPGSHVAVEWKGVYAVENMLITRHLMYWQVYLHKAVVAGDQLLSAVVRRVRQCVAEDNTGALHGMTPALAYFMERSLDASATDDADVLDAFLRLDDSDVVSSLKSWQRSTDKVLADLARRFLRRDMPRCTFLDAPPTSSAVHEWQDQVALWLCATGLSLPEHAAQDVGYYLTTDCARGAAYPLGAGPIRVLTRDGQLRELSAVADTPALKALTSIVEKPFVCCPKGISLVR